MAADDPTDKMTPEERAELERVLEYVKAEEGAAQASRLASLDSIVQFISTNPSLRESQRLLDMFNQYGPALLQLVQRLV